MNLQKNMQVVHVVIDSITLTIIVENIGTTAHGLYFAKCGYYYDGKELTSAGLSDKKNLAIQKCISEFCERVSLFFCNGEVKMNSKKIVPVLRNEVFNVREKCINITRFSDKTNWLIPLSLFNPKKANKTRVIDGTGFAAHKNKKAAILHSLCEIQERHCVGLFWDNCKTIDLLSVKKDFSNLSIKAFLKKNKLKLKSFQILPHNNIPIACSIALLIDNKKHCYFGSAARMTIELAIESAILESILMYLNINSIWKNKKDVSGRSLELLNSYNKSDEYMHYINSCLKKVLVKDTFKNDSKTSINKLLNLFNNYYEEIYYKDIGIIHDRYVIKFIVPKAYLRQPYGFKCSYEKQNIKKNSLSYPFG
jgi:hypothetical protein